MSRAAHSVARPWLLVIIVSFILIELTAWFVGGPDDVQAARDTADYAAELQADGAAHCADIGRTPIFVTTGELICRLTEPLVAQGGKP